MIGSPLILIAVVVGQQTGSLKEAGEKPKPAAKPAARVDSEKAISEYNVVKAKTPMTAAARWKLALWCEEHGLSDFAYVHFGEVISLDPGRDAAWRKLGFKKQGNRWASEAEIAEELELKKADKRWGPLLKKVHKDIHGGGFEMIGSPLVVLAILVGQTAAPKDSGEKKTSAKPGGRTVSDKVMSEYNVLKANTPMTAAARWKLALWCEEHRLKDLAIVHLGEVISLDPSRDAAWRKLGFKKLGEPLGKRRSGDRGGAEPEEGGQEAGGRCSRKCTRTFTWDQWQGEKKSGWRRPSSTRSRIPGPWCRHDRAFGWRGRDGPLAC